MPNLSTYVFRRPRRPLQKEGQYVLRLHYNRHDAVCSEFNSFIFASNLFCHDEQIRKMIIVIKTLQENMTFYTFRVCVL